MVNINIYKELSVKLPSFKVVSIEAEIENSLTNEKLWLEINRAGEEFREKYTFESYKKIPAIAEARAAYKKLGKDPSRYRLSSEALVKRILDGKELYKVSTAVDLINLISIRFYHSIGLFDSTKIEGNITVRGGYEGEVYDSHGKANMNLENLPVYADSVGAFGSTTTDSLRTRVGLETKHILMVINCFEECDDSDELIFTEKLLKKYLSAKNIAARKIE